MLVYMKAQFSTLPERGPEAGPAPAGPSAALVSSSTIFPCVLCGHTHQLCLDGPLNFLLAPAIVVLEGEQREGRKRGWDCLSSRLLPEGHYRLPVSFTPRQHPLGSALCGSLSKQ